MGEIGDYLSAAAAAMASLDAGELERAAGICSESILSGGTIFFCGNGGSAADSMHLAAELVGRFSRDRNPIRALALTADTAVLTAVANDFGYDLVFARQIEALGRTGDVLVAISTSGSSPCVLRAVESARSAGMKVIAMTGERGAGFAASADAAVVAPSGFPGHVQEVLLAAGHALCLAVENSVRSA